MISHPLDAPSNLSVSVSSIMRLLISNRIIAADAGVEEKGGISGVVWWGSPLCVKFCKFFPALTDPTASVEATSARNFRVFYSQGPNKTGASKIMPVINS